MLTHNIKYRDAIISDMIEITAPNFIKSRKEILTPYFLAIPIDTILADAPIIVPVKLAPTLLVFLTSLTLKIFIDTTIPANIDKIKISKKLNAVSG